MDKLQQDWWDAVDEYALKYCSELDGYNVSVAEVVAARTRLLSATRAYGAACAVEGARTNWEPPEHFIVHDFATELLPDRPTGEAP